MKVVLVSFLMCVFSLTALEHDDGYKSCVVSCQRAQINAANFIDKNHGSIFTEDYVTQLNGCCSKKGDQGAYNKCAVECAYLCQKHYEWKPVNKEFFEKTAGAVSVEDWMLAPKAFPDFKWGSN